MYGFSDGSPYVELIIFLSVFFAAFAVSHVTSVAATLDQALRRLAGFLRRKLFIVDDPTVEQRRIDLVRILLGWMMLMRNFWDFVTAVDLNEPAVIAATFGATALSFFIMVGLLAPLALFLLGVLINIIFDNISDSSTLASQIASMCCMALAFAPAGRSFSVDAIVLRADNGFGRIWRGFYDFVGPLTLDRAAIAKFSLILAYGGISFSSALLHLQTENWVDGITNAWVFLNPVMSPNHHPIALAFYEWSPALFVLSVQITIYGTLVFQLGFVPLLLISRWTQCIVIILELGFVFGSVTVLALHWLGWFQLALCILLFWNSFGLNVGKRSLLTLYYDSESNLSTRFAQTVKSLDLFDTLLLRASDPVTRPPFATRPYFSAFALDLNGRVYADWDFAAALCGRIVILFPFWPIAAVARLMATRKKQPARLRASGSGSLTSRASCLPPVRSQYLGPLTRALALSFATMFVAFALRFPIDKYAPIYASAGELSKRLVGAAPLAYGLMQINAFNFPPLSGTMPTFDVTWSKDNERRFLFTIPASRANIRVSDMLFYQVQTTFNFLQFDGTCFSERFSNALFNRLALRALLSRSEYAGGEFHIRMKAYTVPSKRDFTERRFVPLNWYDVCEATFLADDPTKIRYQYFQEGLDALAVKSPLPFAFSAEAAPLAVKYPCGAEADRLAYWFDHPQFAGRHPDVEPRIAQFMKSSRTATGLGCLLEGIALVQMVYTNWRPEQPPSPNAPCAPDIPSARAMVEAGLDKVVFGTRQNFDRALVAHSSGDDRACLLLLAEVRRGYYGAITARAPAPYKPFAAAGG